MFHIDYPSSCADVKNDREHIAGRVADCMLCSCAVQISVLPSSSFLRSCAGVCPRVSANLYPPLVLLTTSLSIVSASLSPLSLPLSVFPPLLGSACLFFANLPSFTPSSVQGWFAELSSHRSPMYVRLSTFPKAHISPWLIPHVWQRYVEAFKGHVCRYHECHCNWKHL